MGASSSSEEKSPLVRNPVNVDVTKQYGSGAEQDRYGQHFANLGGAVGEKVKDGFQELSASTRGSSGAEQDRYDARFGVKGGPDRVREAARSGYERTREAASSGYDQARDKAERGYDQAREAAARGYERAKQALDKAVHAKGDGAEQDTYGAHFDFTTLDLRPVTQAALSIISKGGNLSAASRHGLGHDGWQRAKYLAAYRGSGAEQDRYEARFGAFGKQAAQAVKEKVSEFKR